jgi:hypothetical protein
MKKYRKRLPYRLTTKRYGFIEERMLNLLGQVAPDLAGSPSERDEKFFLGLISAHKRLVRRARLDLSLSAFRVPRNASERKRECDDGKRAADHRNNQHRSVEEALASFDWRLDDPSVSLFHLCLHCR